MATTHPGHNFFFFSLDFRLRSPTTFRANVLFNCSGQMGLQHVRPGGNIAGFISIFIFLIKSFRLRFPRFDYPHTTLFECGATFRFRTFHIFLLFLLYVCVCTKESNAIFNSGNFTTFTGCSNGGSFCMKSTLCRCLKTFRS